MSAQPDFFPDPSAGWKSSKAPGEALVFNEPRFEMFVDLYRDCQQELERVAGTRSEDGARFMLKDAVLHLLVEPCVTRTAVVRKIEFVLGAPKVMQLLVENSHLVRVLLSSLVCVAERERRKVKSVVEFQRVLSSCQASYAVWREKAENEELEDDDWSEIGEAFAAVLSFPCGSACFVAYKAAFILQYEDLGPSGEDDIRTLLASFMCLKEGV